MRKILSILVGIIILFIGVCYLVITAADGAASVLIHGALVGFAVYLFARDALVNKIRLSKFNDSTESVRRTLPISLPISTRSVADKNVHKNNFL